MSKFKEFQKALTKAKNVVVLTGAGVSAESGIPTFRDKNGLWRQYEFMDLATPEAFESNPALVWQFYQYRRIMASKAKPNASHYAITNLEQKLLSNNISFTLITQNIDELHKRANTKNIIEMHGSLFRFKNEFYEGFKEDGINVYSNYNLNICDVLTEKTCAPNISNDELINIDISKLPHDENGVLLRPAVVWFGEALDYEIMNEINSTLDKCDFLIIIGTSGVVYPAANFARLVQINYGVVSEFNLEPTSLSKSFDYFFQGKSGDLLPEAFDIQF